MLARFLPLLIILIIVGLTACEEHGHEHSHSHSDDHSHSHEEYHRLTFWDAGLEVFARFELHENSGRIEGELFVSEGKSPVEHLSGEIHFMENRRSVTAQELEARRNGIFPFELFFEDSDEPQLAVIFQIGDEEYEIELGSVYRYAGHPEEPDVDDLAVLEKPMQWQMSIKSDVASTREIPDVVAGFGTILQNPQHYYEVRSPVDGHIDLNDSGILPSPGITVEGGDRLVAISPQFSSENSWTGQRLAYEQAKEAFERAERLLENDAISLREYQQREREYEVRRAGYHHFIESTHHGATIEDAGSDLYLNAVQSAVVAESYVVSGREVRQGDLLFTLFDPRYLWLEVLANRNELAGLPEITGAEIVMNRDERVTLSQSEVSLVSRDLRSDASGSRSKITLSVDNSSGSFSLNQPVRVRLKGSEGQYFPAVPNEALFDNESHKVIFIVHSGDQFERRMVQTGGSYGGWTAITEGLEEGERVVTQGIYPLHLMTGNVQIEDDHDH
ncbi:MAG: hypothetical protein JJU46_04300 [Balneolaceae bacterium]|nr:hypothetical protein [Balneolaceae bacterium]MCH8548986.1 hypothetical protein [Balneolaceae bacterium]